MRTIIPEEIFIECIKSANNRDLQAEGICPECGKPIYVFDLKIKKFK